MMEAPMTLAAALCWLAAFWLASLLIAGWLW